MRVFVTVVLLLVCRCAIAQQEQRGVTLHQDAAFDGYTLFSPLGTGTTMLVDIKGQVVQSWKSEHMPANDAYLLPNGELVRAAKFMDNAVFGNRGPISRTSIHPSSPVQSDCPTETR